MILLMDSQFASDLNHITLQMESFYQFTNLKIKHIQRNVELSDAYDIRVSSLLNLCSRLVEKTFWKCNFSTDLLSGWKPLCLFVRAPIGHNAGKLGVSFDDKLLLRLLWWNPVFFTTANQCLLNAISARRDYQILNVQPFASRQKQDCVKHFLRSNNQDCPYNESEHILIP